MWVGFEITRFLDLQKMYYLLPTRRIVSVNRFERSLLLSFDVNTHTSFRVLQHLISVRHIHVRATFAVCTKAHAKRHTHIRPNYRRDRSTRNNARCYSASFDCLRVQIQVLFESTKKKHRNMNLENIIQQTVK